MTVIKGEQTGEVIKEGGKKIIKQYDYFCLRHRNPVKMHQAITMEPQGLTILSKMCPRCNQIVKEGEYLEGGVS